MIISTIVAVSENEVIGKNNQLPWHLPADLKYFKKITNGHHVLMGRKCFESIGKPLPGRTNLVLTRNNNYQPDGIVKIHTIDDGINIAKEHGETELFILGGADVFRLTMPVIDKLYFNTIHAEFEGDTFWPKTDWTQWKLDSTEYHDADTNNLFPYSFSVFTRRK